MFSLTIFVIVIATVYAADPDCRNYNGADDTICEKWGDLRYLWSPGTVTGYTNNSIPRTAIGLAQSGKPITILSQNCVNTQADGTTWYGIRVAVNEKQSVVVLYDWQGTVAGIQARFPKSSVGASIAKYDQIPMFQSEKANGIDYWVLTAYTVDPQSICKETQGQGRPESVLTTNDGTGDRLVFQNGKTPASLLKAPRMRNALALAAGYADNNCFATMGTHTFHGMDSVFESNNCDTITPVFLLYNKQNYCVGFGFDWVGTTWDDTSYESPPADAIKQIVGDRTPQCLLDLANNKAIGITTMHVFFVNRNPNKLGTPLCSKPT